MTLGQLEHPLVAVVDAVALVHVLIGLTAWLFLARRKQLPLPWLGPAIVVVAFALGRETLAWALILVYGGSVLFWRSGYRFTRTSEWAGAILLASLILVSFFGVQELFTGVEHEAALQLLGR